MENKIIRHRSPAVLLLVDVVNHFEFPDGEAILKNALQIALSMKNANHVQSIIFQKVKNPNDFKSGNRSGP